MFRPILLLLLLCSPVWGQIIQGGSQPVNSGNLDASFGNTRGSILERGAAGWQAIVPNPAGQAFISNGAGLDPSYQFVGNSSLATAPANTLKCNPTIAVGTPKDCIYPYINVMDFGATGNGVTDDTSSIQNAINACPSTSGCVVLFPGVNGSTTANYKVSTALAVGNGSSSTASTRNGVVLQGVGNPMTELFPGFIATAGPKITWAGGNNSSIISVNGPLQGWGVQNLYLDCASTTGMTGITVTSAQEGDSRNLTIVNCPNAGVYSTTVALFGAFTNTDSIRNKWYGLNIVVPNIAASKGIVLTGVASATSNTDYNNFYNTSIFLPSATVVVYGVYLQVTDSSHFYGTHIYGGNVNANCVTFDYALNSSFPSSTRFSGLDIGTCGGATNPYTVGGTPGVNARAHQLYIDVGNAGQCPNNLVNTFCQDNVSIITNPGGNNSGNNILSAWSVFTPSPTCGSATITIQSSRGKTIGKTSFLEAEFTITAIGSCTNNLSFTAPNTAASISTFSGQETFNTGRGVTCIFTPGGTTVAACHKTDASNWAVNDSFIVSGVYENQ